MDKQNNYQGEERNPILICPVTGKECLLGCVECFYLDCELYHFVITLDKKLSCWSLN